MARTPSLLLASAVCGAALAWAPPSAADDLIPSLSLQTGMTFTRSPRNNTNDYFVAATPQLTYFIEGDRMIVTMSYALTVSLNTVLPNAIANRVAVAAVYDVAPKTRLLFGADALQSLIGNYLIVRRAAATQIGGLPNLNTSLLAVGVNQGISHELSPVVRLTQGVTGAYVTSIDPDVQLRNYLATATVGIDRSWEFDAVGGELTLQYARTFLPPIPTSNAVTAALGPTWDHDLSPAWSTSMGAAVQFAVSPDPGTDVRVGPSGRASIFYSEEGSGIGLDYAGGIEPNLLLGTLLQSHQVTLRGFTPISEKNRIVLGVSGGYLHAKNLSLQTNNPFDNEFDAVLHDADITWAATDWLSLFTRYQFIGQSSGAGSGATPPIVRHGVILGLELFATRPPERSRLPPTGFPKRVDRSDGLQQGRPGGSPAGSSPGSSVRR